jgi:HlyD family secretion protein
MNKQTNIIMVVVALLALFACGKKTQETKPVRQDITETVFASGMLEAEGTYNLTAMADGYLQQVNFKEGDMVMQGKTMAVIDNKENMVNTISAEALYNIAKTNTSPNSPALVQAANAIQVAKEKLQLDSIQMQRYNRLVQANSIAKSEYDNSVLQYNTSKKNYESSIENYRQLQKQYNEQLINNSTQKQISHILFSNNKVKALVNGKVYKKYKQPGDFVKKGDVIALIGDAEFIYARVNVDESNIGRIKIDQPALIQLNTDTQKVYHGKVSEIYPAFDETTQSFICKIYFTDSLDFKITGTQLQTNIITGQQQNALLIPRNFLDAGGHVHIKGNKNPVKVTTKFVSNNWVQVLSGINDNTVIITDNIKENKAATSETGSLMH